MRADSEQRYHERILRVQLYIQKHLDEVLSLEELARMACFSPVHFHRIFRGILGESVKEHIRRLRLDRAALQLKGTDEPVTRVAFGAGYQTHESFSRAFRAMFAPHRLRQNPENATWNGEEGTVVQVVPPPVPTKSKTTPM